MKGKIKVTASGGTNTGANLKPLEKRPRPMPMQGMQGSPNPVNMSGRMDKAPPRRTPAAEIKGYLAKVAREDREDQKSKERNLDRAMRGTESKAIKEDLRAAREDRMSKSSAPSKSPRPMSRPASAMGGKSSAPSKSPRPMRSPVKKAMGGMVKGYKDGGCVMAGRGGGYKGQM
jgi:hypothetical protein